MDDTLYAKPLKAKTLELRKSRDPMATFLISVGAKAQDLAKSEDPAATSFGDEHALRAINSFIKGADDNIKLLSEAQDSPLYSRAVAERTLLKTFLPQEASEEAVNAEITNIIDNSGQPKSPKLTGLIMGELTKKFGDSLNKRKASDLIKAALAN